MHSVACHAYCKLQANALSIIGDEKDAQPLNDRYMKTIRIKMIRQGMPNEGRSELARYVDMNLNSQGNDKRTLVD